MEDAKKKHRWPKRLLWGGVSVLTVAGLLFLAAQSSPAKRRMARLLSSNLTARLPWPVSIEGVGGFLPFVATVEKIVLGPPDDPWLVLEGAGLDLDLLPLLGRRLEIESLSAETAVLHHLPRKDDLDEDEPFAIPLIAALPTWLRLDSLEVDRAVLGEDVTGTPITLKVEGAYLPETGEAVSISVTGIEGTDLEAAVRGSLGEENLNLDFNARDTTLLPSRLGIAEGIAVTLKLAGPRSAAALEAEVKRGEVSIFSIKGTSAYAEPLRFKGESRIVLPADRISAAVLEKIGSVIDAGLDIELAKGGIARIHGGTAAFDGGTLEIAGSYELATGTLGLNPVLRFDDLHHLAGQPNPGDKVALEARLPVRGTLPEIVIEPEATLNGEPWLAGTISLTLDERQGAKASLQMFPAGGLLPDAYRDLLAEGATVALDASYSENKAAVRNAAITAANIAVTAHGNYDAEAQLFDLAAKLSLTDMGAFEAPAKRPLGGALTLDLAARGGATETRADCALAVEQLIAGTVAAPSGKLTLSAAGASVFSAGALTDRLAITVDGAFPGLGLKAGLARDLTVKGSALIESLRRVTVSGFEISDGNLLARTDGAIDVETRAADFTSDLAIAQLSDYAALVGHPIEGGATLQARAESTSTPGTISAQWSGKLTKLGGLPDAAQRLLGASAEFSGEGRYDGETVGISAFQWASQQVQTTATGSFNPTTRAIDGALHGTIADLAPLSALAKRSLAGAAEFNLDIEGDLQSMSAKGALKGGPIQIDPLRAEAAEITFSATGLPSEIDGELAAALEQSGRTLSLNTRAGKRGTVITVAQFDASAAGNTVSGSGRFDLDRMRGHGEMAAQLPRLDALKAWIDLPLEGSLNADVKLDETSGRLQGRTSGEGVVLSGASLGMFSADFDLAGPLIAPAGLLAIRAAEIRRGDWRVAALSLQANGPADAWALALKSEGTFKDSTNFQIGGEGQWSRATENLRLSALQLTADDHHFALRAPASVSWRKKVLTIDSLALDGDSGHVALSGACGPASIDLDATLESIPLHMAEIAGADPPSGTVSGTILLSGAPASPVLEAAIRLAGFNPAPEVDNNFPGLDAEVKANYAAGVLRVAGAAAVPGAGHIEGDASLSTTWTLSPWRFELARDEPLRGTFKARGDLSAIPPVLALEDELRGKANADFALAGTLGAPGIQGGATISEGYYENGSSGTILKDIEAVLEANGNTVRLASLTASDGARGTITGEGEARLLPGGGTPFVLALKLDQTRLVHRDNMRAEGGGSLELRGDENGAVVSGDLRITPAEIALPERTASAQVATVPFTVAGEVVEVDGPAPRGPYLVSLDVRGEFPGRVYFRGPGLDSEWEGNLSASGDVKNPSVRGTLRVRKGRLDFLGREFDLGESTINFDGETPPAPYINILATAEAEDIVARVRIEGMHNALAITLESEPPLPRDEILARVLFGQEISEISPVQALTLARYAPMFSKNATAQAILGRGAASNALVDRFSLRGGTGVGEASITTGKYLTDELYLEFEQGLGSAESLVSLEWLFAPEWSLKARTTSQGEGGVGVFWKRNY